jgi:hypothetical protein
MDPLGSDPCWACKHKEECKMDGTYKKDGLGHDPYGYPYPCRTPGCSCQEYVRVCAYPTCKAEAEKQYRDQYSREEDPYLCKEHDTLREFIEDCVKGALRKL